MATNIEIKARVRELAAIEQRARAMGARGPTDIRQDDTFFACTHGRLKLREFADGGGELIQYSRADASGPKASDYHITRVTDPASLRETLTRALGQAGRVRKRRRLYLLERTRIHLDDVEGLGTFVELEVVLAEGDAAEGGHAEAQRVMAGLGIGADDLLRGAYVDLMR